MRKKISILILVLVILFSFTGCQRFSVSLNTVGKDNTTAKKISKAINENLASEKLQNYKLYSVNISTDTEGIGSAHLFYTNKLQQELQYSDIIVVEVDTRTGKINSVEDADFTKFGTEPYDAIVGGAPLEMQSWKKDSDQALAIAQNEFFGEDNFLYNYVQTSAVFEDGVCQYKIVFISFVNRLQYSCCVDGMTGAVISREISDL